MKTFIGVFIVGLFIFTSTTITFAMCLRSKDISGGEDHTLVLTEAETVFSCGANYLLQLGNENAGDYEDLLINVEDGKMETLSDMLEVIIGISAGWTHSLANDDNGFVWSWGNDAFGQLGDGLGDSSSSTPVQVSAGEQNPTTDPNDPHYLQDIEKISAGRSGKHSLAVDKYGLAWSWGINTYGQLGCGDTVTRYVPVAVYSGEQNPTEEPNQLSHIVDVSGGAWHSLALEDPNQGAHVYAFGINTSWGGDGLLGVGKTYEQLPYTTEPNKVLSGAQDSENNDTFLQNIVAVSAGWHHSMALEKLDDNDPNSNGRVYSWGGNGIG